MSKDTKKPAPCVETQGEARKLVTANGVEVHVKAPPPPPPRREPEPGARHPDAIIMPEGLTEAEKQAWLNALCKKHATMIDEILARRQDLGEQSKKSMRQRVLVILFRRVEAGEVIEHPRAWLMEVIRKDTANYLDLWKPPIDDGADATRVAAPSQEEPEETAQFDEQWAALERYLVDIPEEQAEVIRCVHMYAMTLEETAISVGRPVTTVFYELNSGRAKLRERAQASARATALEADGTLEEK